MLGQVAAALQLGQDPHDQQMTMAITRIEVTRPKQLLHHGGVRLSVQGVDQVTALHQIAGGAAVGGQEGVRRPIERLPTFISATSFEDGKRLGASRYSAVGARRDVPKPGMGVARSPMLARGDRAGGRLVWGPENPPNEGTCK